MNLDAIGAVAELVGATAVFVSLIYLAVQIKNSKRSDQIIAASQAASAMDEWLGQIVRDTELHELYRRGLGDYASLTRQEKSRFATLIVQFLRSVETIWLHRHLDTIDAEYWRSVEKAVERIVGSAGGIRAFDRNRDVLTAGFVHDVDVILGRSKDLQGRS